MRYIIIILIFLAAPSVVFSQNSCDPGNIKVSEWNSIDSNRSYYLCSPTTKAIYHGKYYKVEYLGRFNEDRKIIKKRPDSSIISLFANIKFGKFLLSDSFAPAPIKEVIAKMGANPESIIKFDLSNIPALSMPRVCTVYFKSGTDSLDATEWISKISKLEYVDSIHFMSREAAIKNWEKEDTAWRSFLAANPLPSLADIYIKPDFYNTGFLEKLKKTFLKEGHISDLNYQSREMIDNFELIPNTLKHIFFIKIKL